MSQNIRVGIIGAGWPGGAHARGYQQAGGCKVVAVADLIPERRQKLASEFAPGVKEYNEAKELIADKEIDAVSVCLPTYLHAPIVLAAFRAKKHVVCEKPPALYAAEAKKMHKAAAKAGKVLLYSVQRRFGGAEQAARLAIEKGYAGSVYHARAQWLRTRGIPIGTGWFPVREKSGGGAMIDIGIHMLDLAWDLLGQPRPASVFATTHHHFKELAPQNIPMNVEDSGFALLKFDGGKTLELSASWVLNQPPQQQGTMCRVYGDKGAIDVYSSGGSVIYRNFNDKGEAKPTSLPPPRVTGHAALMRHFRECILGKSTPMVGGPEGVVLMQMIDAIYRSARTGKSIDMK
jgi:predicted dehydrogenase